MGEWSEFERPVIFQSNLNLDFRHIGLITDIINLSTDNKRAMVSNNS